MENTKKWYQSTTIIGGIISLLSTVVFIFKIDIDNETITNFVNLGFQFVGVIMVIFGRINAAKTIK